MNRRRFFAGVLGAGAATAVSSEPHPRAQHDRLVTTGPRRPGGFNFDLCLPVECDVAAVSVTQVLAWLGWHSGAPERPLLVAHTSALPYALRANRELDGLLDVYFTATELADPDEWFVEWRGKRAGSVGA